MRFPEAETHCHFLEPGFFAVAPKSKYRFLIRQNDPAYCTVHSTVCLTGSHNIQLLKSAQWVRLNILSHSIKQIKLCSKGWSLFENHFLGIQCTHCTGTPISFPCLRPLKRKISDKKSCWPGSFTQGVGG